MSTDDAVWNEIADVPESTPPAMTDAEVAEPRSSLRKRVDYAISAGWQRHIAERGVAADCMAEEVVTLIDEYMAHVLASAARLRQERNEARALQQQAEDRTALAESAVGEHERVVADRNEALRRLAAYQGGYRRLKAERDAAEERYTRLVGDVEAVAATIRPATWSNPTGAALADVSDRLRRALADCSYSADLTSVAKNMSADVSSGRSALAATAPQTAPAQRATLAEGSPVGLCGDSYGYGFHNFDTGLRSTRWVSCHLAAGHTGMHSDGTTSWSAHPAGDEHLQALRDGANAPMIAGVAWARLVKGLRTRGELDHVAPIEEAVTVALDAYDHQNARRRKAERERDEARREAERLRGEVAKLETFASEVVTELNPLPLGTYRAALICLRSVRDQLRALAGSSDTTAGGE